MKVGEQRILKIPSNLAYGSKGAATLALSLALSLGLSLSLSPTLTLALTLALTLTLTRTPNQVHQGQGW